MVFQKLYSKMRIFKVFFKYITCQNPSIARVYPYQRLLQFHRRNLAPLEDRLFAFCAFQSYVHICSTTQNREYCLVIRT